MEKARNSGKQIAQQQADQYWKSYALKIPSLSQNVTRTRTAYESAKKQC